MTENMNSKVIGISGPSGAGKDYLSKQMIEKLGLERVAMVTTRPARPEGEEKICISQNEYQKLVEDGELVGDHENKGFRYGYRIKDLTSVSKAIIELNPVYQSHLPKELLKWGIDFAGWIGLVGDPQYLIDNMNSRQVMSEDERIKRLDMANQIMGAINKLSEENIVTPYHVGWDNRQTMADEVAQLAQKLIEEK